MNERVKDFVADSMGYLAVAFVTVVYLATAVFVPGFVQKSVWTIVAEGATGFALGIVVGHNLKLQGIMKGSRDKRMLATRKLHGETVERIAPFINRLDGWCAMQNDDALKRERTRILAAAGLRYEDCFDIDGVAREVDLSGLPEETVKMRKKALKAARRTKMTPLSTATLTGDGGRSHDPFYFGETPEQYQRRTDMTDMASKIVMALIFGYFGVSMVEDFQFAELAWRALYVAILLALGSVKMVRAYLFVTDTYRGSVVQKINHLQSFENYAKEVEKNGEEQLGGVQNGAGEAACGETGSGKAGRLCEQSEAAQISAPARSGTECGNDGERADRGE